LVGMGAVISYVISISQEGAIWVSPTWIHIFVTPRHLCIGAKFVGMLLSSLNQLAAASVFFYTVAGGLFSVAYSGECI
jgi:hypothetical protein